MRLFHFTRDTHGKTTRHNNLYRAVAFSAAIDEDKSVSSFYA